MAPLAVGRGVAAADGFGCTLTPAWWAAPGAVANLPVPGCVSEGEIGVDVGDVDRCVGQLPGHQVGKELPQAAGEDGVLAAQQVLEAPPPLAAERHRLERLEASGLDRREVDPVGPRHVHVLVLVELPAREHEPGVLGPDTWPDLGLGDAGLLVELPEGGRLAGLPGLHAPTGDLPPVALAGVGRIASLQEQHVTVPVEYDDTGGRPAEHPVAH